MGNQRVSFNFLTIFCEAEWGRIFWCILDDVNLQELLPIHDRNSYQSPTTLGHRSFNRSVNLSSHSGMNMNLKRIDVHCCI